MTLIFTTGLPITIANIRLDAVLGEEAGLKLKEKLLEKEKDLLATQNEWLTQEVQSISEQLAQLKKERTSSVVELESRLAAKNDEVWN